MDEMGGKIMNFTDTLKSMWDKMTAHYVFEKPPTEAKVTVLFEVLAAFADKLDKGTDDGK